MIITVAALNLVGMQSPSVRLVIASKLCICLKLAVSREPSCALPNSEQHHVL
jgi:hypothetical protein